MGSFLQLFYPSWSELGWEGILGAENENLEFEGWLPSQMKLKRWVWIFKQKGRGPTKDSVSPFLGSPGCMAVTMRLLIGHFLHSKASRVERQMHDHQCWIRLLFRQWCSGCLLITKEKDSCSCLSVNLWACLVLLKGFLTPWPAPQPFWMPCSHFSKSDLVLCLSYGLFLCLTASTTE
jgi:hypothetical protein